MISRRFLPSWTHWVTIDLSLLAFVWGEIALATLITVPFAILMTANIKMSLVVLALALYLGAGLTIGCLRIREPK